MIDKEDNNEIHKLFGVERLKEVNFEALSDNKEVIKMLKEKMELEKKIQSLDEFALILLELQLLEIG